MSASSTKGLEDKLYWRNLGTLGWHCFARAAGTVRGKAYVSLCERYRITRTAGQAIDRPEPLQRCGLCDGREAARRGHEESMPARRDPGSLARERAADRRRYAARAATEAT